MEVRFNAVDVEGVEVERGREAHEGEEREQQPRLAHGGEHVVCLVVGDLETIVGGGPRVLSAYMGCDRSRCFTEGVCG
jgi:hypothetical protein